MVIDFDARIQQPEITNQPGAFVRFSYQKGRRVEWNIRFRWFFNNAKLHQFGDFLTHEDAFVFRWLICLSKEVVSVGFQFDVINKFATFSQFTPETESFTASKHNFEKCSFFEFGQYFTIIPDLTVLGLKELNSYYIFFVHRPNRPCHKQHVIVTRRHV